MVNNTEVAAPPSMTSRHSIRTSGRNLYIAENKPVMMTKETTKFRTCKTTSCAGRMEADDVGDAPAGLVFRFGDQIHLVSTQPTLPAQPDRRGGEVDSGRSQAALAALLKQRPGPTAEFQKLLAAVHMAQHPVEFP